MLRTLALLASALSFFVMAGISAAQDEQAQADPLLGERLVEGIATPDRLWLRNDAGAVIEFSRPEGERRELATGGVIDMAKVGEKLLALRGVGGDSDVYEVVDLLTGAPASPRLQAEHDPIGLLADDGLTLLTPTKLYRLENHAWFPTALSEPVGGAPRFSVASSDSGIVYVGRDFGEWGGGLWSIDPVTGAVAEVRRIGGELCDGPLGRECDPVTGVVRDGSHAGCMLASVGLSHLLAHGRILRICGDAVEVVYEEDIPARAGAPALPSTWPFFGLTAAGGRWAAVSYGRLFLGTDDGARSIDLPVFEPWNGVPMASVGDDFLILRTDLNASASLSGRTPLLVPITG